MQSNDARILRGAAMIAAPVGIVATVASVLIDGEKGLIGALVGLAVVAFFYGLGFAALMRLTRDRPQVAMMAGMLIYAVQILLMGVFIIVFSGTTLFNGKAFALTLLATALAWIGGQVRCSLTSRMLYVDPEPSVPARKSEPAKPATADDATGSETGSNSACTKAVTSADSVGAHAAKAGSTDGT
jgi:ATP synthase protein I